MSPLVRARQAGRPRRALKATLAAALLAFSAAAAAQPGPGPVSTPDPQQRQADDALLDSVRKSKQTPEPPPAAIAQALSLTFGATFFNEVRVSTAGAVVDLSGLSREGFYKLELIQLLLLSAKSHAPLAQLAERRRKGDTLRDLSFKNGVDYDTLYDASLAVEDIVDRDYLPRFPQRRPPKERDEP